MAWGDPNDYWWLKPEQPNEALPAMQFGAQLRQQAINTALQQKQTDLEAQRTGILLQEHFSKQEIQNKQLAGGAKLAQALSGVTNWADPSVLKSLWSVAAEQPEVLSMPAWQLGFKRHEDAVLANSKLKELEAGRQQRAAVAVDRMNAIFDRTDAMRERTTSQAETADQKLQLDKQWKADRTRLYQIGQETKRLLADSAVDVSDARIQKLQSEAENIDARTRGIGETVQTKNISAADKMDDEAEAFSAVDPDYADRLRTNADLLRGSMKRASAGGTAGVPFVPQEMTTAGGTYLVQVSPNRWSIKDKPFPAGRMTDVEKSQIKDIRTEQDALAPLVAKKPSGMFSGAATKEYDANVAKMDALTKRKQAIYESAEKRAGEAPSAKPITKEKAVEFLNQAAGDKEKARKLARDAGYEF